MWLLWVILALVALAAIPAYRFLHDLHYFMRVLDKATRLNQNNRRKQAIALLEQSAGRKALAVPSAKLGVHLTLGKLYHMEWDFDAAAAQLQLALECLRESPDIGMEVECLRVYADIRDAQDRTEEADALLSRADALLAGSAAKGNPVLMENRAKLLERRGKHSDAARVYRDLLNSVPANHPPEARAHLLVQLSLACFNSARYQEGLAAALEATTLPVPPGVRSLACRQTVLQCNSLGDFDRATEYQRKAVEAARESGADDLKQAELSLANIHFFKGELAQAEAVVEQAESGGSSTLAIRCALRYEIALARGDYKRASQALETAEETQPLVFAALNRRTQAARQRAWAQLYLETGRADRAIDAAREARDTFARDEILGLYTEAILIASEALKTPHDPSLGTRRKAVEKRGETLAGEREGGWQNLRELAFFLAYGAFLSQDYAEALRLLDKAGQPRPVYRPRNDYYRGECLRLLGRTDEARAAYEAAVATGIDCLGARLSLEQLMALESLNSKVTPAVTVATELR